MQYSTPCTHACDDRTRKCQLLWALYTRGALMALGGFASVPPFVLIVIDSRWGNLSLSHLCCAVLDPFMDMSCISGSCFLQRKRINGARDPIRCAARARQLPLELCSARLNGVLCVRVWVLNGRMHQTNEASAWGKLKNAVPPTQCPTLKQRCSRMSE